MLKDSIALWSSNVGKLLAGSIASLKELLLVLRISLFFVVLKLMSCCSSDLTISYSFLPETVIGSNSSDSMKSTEDEI